MKGQPIWGTEWWDHQPTWTDFPALGEYRDTAVELPDSDNSLTRALGLHYGLSVRAFQQLRSATGVLADDGTRYVWKPLKHPESVTRLAGIEWLVARLRDSGVLAAGPIANEQNHLFCRIDEQRIGYLQPWLPGNHLDPKQREERLAAVATVGRMHVTTTVPSGPVSAINPVTSRRNGTSLLFRRLFHKRQVVLRVWPQLLEQFPEWQHLGPNVFGGMAKALEAADGTRFAIEPPSSWCHRDLAPHNLLWDGQRVGLIDFDLAAVDDPLGDLLQICNHALYLGAVRNASEWFDVIDLYATCTGMRETERERIKGLLQFPETLVRALTDWIRAGQQMDGTIVHHALECERKRHDWVQQLWSS